MAVKIRLTRVGKKKQPSYRVVVVDGRKSRDSAYIEQIGRYDPRQDPSLVEIDNDRAVDWLQKGAQPTERAQKLLEISGAWGRFRVARGEIHTAAAVATPPAAADRGDDTGTDTDAGHVPEVHVVGASDPVPAAAATDASPDAAVEPVAEAAAATEVSDEDAADEAVEPPVDEAVEPPVDEAAVSPADEDGAAATAATEAGDAATGPEEET